MKHITKVLFVAVLILVLSGASCDEPPTPTPFQGTLKTAVPFIIVTSAVHGEGFYHELTVTPSGTQVVQPTEVKATKTPGPIMITIPDETRGAGWAIQVTATP